MQTPSGATQAVRKLNCFSPVAQTFLSVSRGCTHPREGKPKISGDEYIVGTQTGMSVLPVKHMKFFLVAIALITSFGRAQSPAQPISPDVLSELQITFRPTAFG